MVNALVLAVIAALIMGILPGLKATGRRLNAHLHELSGRSGTRLGALWTTLVVAQVGAAVAVLPAACYMAGICGCSRSTARLRRGEIRGRGAMVPEEVVAVDANRAARVQREMTSRLEAEPGVAAVLGPQTCRASQAAHASASKRASPSRLLRRGTSAGWTSLSTCSMFTAPSSRLGVVSLPATLVRRTRSS